MCLIVLIHVSLPHYVRIFRIVIRVSSFDIKRFTYVTQRYKHIQQKMIKKEAIYTVCTICFD